MIRLKDKEFKEIAAYVKDNYGINLSKKKTLIECRLGKELEKFRLDSFARYLDLLNSDKTGRVAEGMINCLSTNYTYFNRENHHFDFFREKLLPELSSAQKPSVYSVWCAGCSTGQECYTLAMVYEDYRKKGNWVPLMQILGTDIAQRALSKAREGVYPVSELEKIPLDWQRQYCRIRDDGYFEIRQQIRKYVRFSQHNLLSDVKREEKYDLIICRNVMIYFEADQKKILIGKLEQYLKKDGYLFIGHTELLQREGISLKSVEPSIYRKK